MAKVMVGQARRDRLYADEFTAYANALASLSRNEALAVTLLHRARPEWEAKSKDEREKEGLFGIARRHAVPAHFPSEDHFLGHLGGATKSGLVLMQSAWNSVIFTTSPLMDEIGELADFQDALRKEGASMP